MLIDTDAITLLTLSGGAADSEALARFERRAGFNGFKEGTTLKVIQPRKFPVTKSAKLELIRLAVKKIVSDSKENADNHIILYIENSLSLILSSPKEILAAFKSTEARILLPADSTNACWLSESKDWPDTNGENTVLNPVAFIGYNKDVEEFLSTKASSLSELFRSTYLEEVVWSKLNVQIDSNQKLFHTLKSDSGLNELELKLNKDGRFLVPQLVNTNTSLPIHIVQTNICKAGNSIVYLNSIASYLTPTLPEDRLELYADDEALPTVTLAIFLEHRTPFLEEFFNHIDELDYNKKKIHLFIHNHYKYNTPYAEAFIEKTGKEYASVKYIPSKDRVKEWAARKLAVNWVIEETKTDYLFSVDSTAHLDDEETLKSLIEANKDIISPMLCLQTEFLPNICNFWGAIDTAGFYAKSSDYDEISEDAHKGIWNVPFINAAYLIKAEILKNEETRPNFINGLDDADLAFALNNRKRGIFMHVTNEFHPGHLIQVENFETWHLHNELYEIFNNRYDWEQRYLHSNYSDNLKENYKPLEPCLDVFWYPIISPRFAKEMIEEMEAYGKWADGSIEVRDSN